MNFFLINLMQGRESAEQGERKEKKEQRRKRPFAEPAHETPDKKDELAEKSSSSPLLNVSEKEGISHPKRKPIAPDHSSYLFPSATKTLNIETKNRHS